MIKINLYDYQRIVQEVTVQKMVTTAIMIVFIALGLTGMTYVSDDLMVTNAREEVQVAKKKVDAIKPQYDAVQKLKTEKEGLNGKIQGLNGLRSSEVPFARLFEDVAHVTPDGVWLEKIEQVKESRMRGEQVPVLFKDPPPPNAPIQDLFVRFQGKATSDRGVVRLMEALENLSHLDHVIMHKSTLSWVGTEAIRNYTVFAHVVGSGPKPETK